MHAALTHSQTLFPSHKKIVTLKQALRERSCSEFSRCCEFFSACLNKCASEGREGRRSNINFFVVSSLAKTLFAKGAYKMTLGREVLTFLFRKMKNPFSHSSYPCQRSQISDNKMLPTSQNYLKLKKKLFLFGNYYFRDNIT